MVLFGRLACNSKVETDGMAANGDTGDEGDEGDVDDKDDAATASDS